jgi:flagellar assembly protein FliH
VETLLSRIIKASETEAEAASIFDFTEILDARPPASRETGVSEADAPDEVEQDALMEIESMIQQRLLEAERRAQEIEQEGYEKGYEQGVKDGTEFGRKSMQVAREQFEALLEKLIDLPRHAFEDYRNWFIAACLAVSRHIVQREMQTRPELLIELMNQVLSSAEESQGITLYVHPKDLELLNSQTSLEDILQGADRVFAMKVDPRMSRGGCRLESDIQMIDASLENRLSILEQTLLEDGDEEGNDTTAQ